MMRTILVPLDGSPLAEAILLYVQVLARLTGAEVTLLGVVEPVDRLIETAVLPTRPQVDLERVVYDNLAETASRLAATGLIARARVATGWPAETIIELARGVDLVAMTTHGRSGVGRWAFGSVADKVVRGASTPVLLVRARPDEAVAAGWPRRILVPLDGSDLAEQALPLANLLAEPARAALILLRSVAWISEISSVESYLHLTGATSADLRERAEARARAELRQVGGALVRPGLSLEIDLRHEPPAEAILIGATERQADLIVMSTHGRGGLGRWTHGSVADRVLRAATVPVLLTRATGAGPMAAAPARVDEA